MAKGKKENKDVPTVVSATGASKDIDAIFAKGPTAKPVHKESLKQTATKVTPSGSAPPRVLDNELANIHMKVKAARAIKQVVAPSLSAQDDFADIRGTKKRKMPLLELSLLVVGKRTFEGLTLYQEDELRIGQGGDTPLCPFDCDCCTPFPIEEC